MHRTQVIESYKPMTDTVLAYRKPIPTNARGDSVLINAAKPSYNTTVEYGTSRKPYTISDLAPYNDVESESGPNSYRQNLPIDFQYKAELREIGPALPRTKIAPIITNPPYMNAPSDLTYATNDQAFIPVMEFKNLYEDDFACKNSCGTAGCNVENFIEERVAINPKNNSTYKVILGDEYAPKDYNKNTTGVQIDNQSPYYMGKGALRGNEEMRGMGGSLPTEQELACGYNPEKLRYGVPVNFPMDPMNLNDDMTDYNKKIFTHRYGDTVYFNEVQENNYLANLQSDHFSHGPVTVEKVGNTRYVTRHAPGTYVPPETKLENPFDERPHMSNVFDGRTIGMGQSYRSYINPVTSTVNYMYDDVDTGSRGFNYLSRNKVDFLPQAEQTGILTEEFRGNTIHKDVHDAFLNNTNDFRDSMIDDFIRQSDARESMQRMYPARLRW